MEYLSTAHLVCLSGLEAHLRDSLAAGWKDPEQTKQDLFDLRQGGQTIEQYARMHQSLHHHLVPHYYYSLERESSLGPEEVQTYLIQKQTLLAQVEKDKVLAFHKGLDAFYRLELESCEWRTMSFAELKRKCLKLESAYLHNTKRPHATLVQQETQEPYPNKYADKQQYFADREAKSQAKRQGFLKKSGHKPKPFSQASSGQASAQEDRHRQTQHQHHTQQQSHASKSDASATCSRCHAKGHAGPWSPLCPHHLPNYVPNRIWRAQHQPASAGGQGSQQARGQQGASAPSQPERQGHAQGSGGQGDRNKQSGGAHKGHKYGNRK